MKEFHQIGLKTTIISFCFNLCREECLAAPSSDTVSSNQHDPSNITHGYDINTPRRQILGFAPLLPEAPNTTGRQTCFFF